MYPIQTPSLIIRKFEMTDVLKLYEMSLEIGMRVWIPDQVYQNEEHTEKVLRFLIAQYSSGKSPEKVPWVFGIYLRKTEELIGHVGLSPCQKKSEIGYAIEESQQGNGYATEAVKAMANWGAKTFSLDLILGIVASDNQSSCRVLEKAGFILLEEKENILHGNTRLVRRYSYE